MRLSLSSKAQSLVLLGRALRLAGEYRRAEPLLVQAVELATSTSAGEIRLEPATAEAVPQCEPSERGLKLAAMNELAVLYKSTGRFDEAAVLYERCFAVFATQAAEDSDDLATLYHNLGGLEHARRRHAAGEPYARKAVLMRERLLGRDHPAVAADVAALAALLDGQGRYEEAELLYRRALSIFERTLGPDHYEVSVSLNNVAAIACARGDYAAAASNFRRALAIKERSLGPTHPEVATTLNNLAIVREKQGDHISATELFARALDILARVLPADHPHVQACQRGYERVADPRRTRLRRHRRSHARIRSWANEHSLSSLAKGHRSCTFASKNQFGTRTRLDGAHASENGRVRTSIRQPVKLSLPCRSSCMRGGRRDTEQRRVV